MPRGGKLTLTTRGVDRDSTPPACREAIHSARLVLLEVKDTGAGMDAATRQRIFEPFFTTKPRGQGTGLGLATVFGVVEQSRGWIDVESEPGRGTAFRIYLPEGRQLDAAAEGEVERVATARVAAHILIVEDESGVNTLARRILENAGYTVTGVSDPNVALERVCVDEQHFDLVLTDVIMPQMSGPQMVRHLRATVPELRVIYMSGYTDEKLAGQGPEVAAATLLAKPFSKVDLLQVVAKALEDAPAKAGGNA
jgi:CheY-like chemotaxis protein